MQNKIKVWSLPVRLLHWGLVASFAIAFYTRHLELMRDIHVLAGYGAGTILISRWLLGFIARDHSGFRRFPLSIKQAANYLSTLFSGEARRYVGHNPAGSVVIYMMLSLGLLSVLTGYMSFNDIALPFYGDEDTVAVAHEVLANAWAIAIVVHVAGVIFGSLAHRENLVAAMVTGDKSRQVQNRQSGLAGEVSVTLLMALIYVIDMILRAIGRKGVILHDS